MHTLVAPGHTSDYRVSLPSPEITLVVCTRNRAASLEQTLRSFGSLEIPPGFSTELLVVDNGSTDRTPKILARPPISHLPLRAVREEKPGLSQARNTAIANSGGQVLLWTDDDVRVDQMWLVKMASPILKGDSDATVGMVRIPAPLHAALAATPLRQRMSYLACTATLDFSRPDRMVGASMAFGRHVLRKVPGFDVALGPGPDSLGFGDDTLFSYRLRACGFRVHGVNDALVDHHFDISRLSQEALVSTARRMGRSEAYMDKRWRNPRRFAPRMRLALVHAAHAVRRTRLLLRGASGVDIDEEQLHYEERTAYWEEFLRSPRR